MLTAEQRQAGTIRRLSRHFGGGAVTFRKLGLTGGEGGASVTAHTLSRRIRGKPLEHRRSGQLRLIVESEPFTAVNERLDRGRWQAVGIGVAGEDVELVQDVETSNNTAGGAYIAWVEHA